VWQFGSTRADLSLPSRRFGRRESYGGGRYALDTSKGADLGGGLDHLVVDLNFLYHPSCRYDSR
jgi:hypothetical protein